MRKVNILSCQFCLRFDVFGVEACDLSSNVSKVTKALASSIVVAINDIERAMGKLGDALHSGEVFKKGKSYISALLFGEEIPFSAGKKRSV